MTAKKRHFLKTEVARRVVAALSTYETKNPLKGKLEVLETSERTLILLNGVPVALCIEKTPFFTVRGALELHPRRHLVTVDMGAVQFIRNGETDSLLSVIDGNNSSHKQKAVQRYKNRK